MNKHILLIVGVAIVGLVQAASTGLTRTYSSLVEAAGTISASNVGIFPSSQNYATTFSTPKSSNFSYAIAITQLYHTFQTTPSEYGRYSTIAKMATISQAGLTVAVTTLLSNNRVVDLKVRYLVVESSFSYIEIVHLSVNSSSGPVPYGNGQIVYFPTSNLSYPIGGNDYMLRMINGLDITETNSTTEQISIRTYCSGSNLSLSCYYSHTLSTTCTSVYLSVDVVLYHQTAMMAELGYDFTFYGLLSLSDSYSYWYVNLQITPYDDAMSFYGFSAFTKRGVGLYPIEFDIFYGNPFVLNITLASTLYLQSMTLTAIYFYSAFDCPSGTDFMANGSRCATCPLTTYYANQSCLSCPFANCSQCDSSSCFNCTAPYLLNVSSCFLCTIFDANCSQCTALGCSNCTSPYVFDGSSCFLCSQLDPNCESCSAAGCLNCTSPFVVNGTSCFLCSDIDLNCNECSASGCTNCTPPFISNNTFCFLCSVYHPQCVSCNPSACLDCQPPFLLNASSCFLCSDLDPNCEDCDAFQCINCSAPYQPNGTLCFLCSQIDPNCQNCTAFSCLACSSPAYYLNSSSCALNCTNIDGECLSCAVNQGVIECTRCSYGRVLDSASTACIPFCGDGVLIGDEQCDDGNTESGDGCSSSCLIETYFSCSTPPNATSTCKLTTLTLSVVCIVKKEYSNQFTLTLSLQPDKLILYSKVQWNAVFSGYSHVLNVSGSSYDQNDGKLRIDLAYGQDLQGQRVVVQGVPGAGSVIMGNLSTVLLDMPERTMNNRILMYFDSVSYALGQTVQYLSMAISVLSLLLFGAGYFGAKLQALQAIAVIQLSSIMLLTVDNTGPTYNGLQYLGWSLGATPFLRGTYFYQSSTLLYSARSQLASNDSISTFNFFLGTVFIPLILAAVFKIISQTTWKDPVKMKKACKYALCSFTFYGLMLLSYGEFTVLTIDIRYFSKAMGCAEGTTIGGFFALLMVCYNIALWRYPVWFGSFKKNLFKYEVSHHIYLFESCERAITSAVVVCFSPGLLAPAVISGLFFLQFLFIFIKKPYVLGAWQRPLANKGLCILLCLLYVGASATGQKSMVNQIIPLALLVVLAPVLVYSTVAAIPSIREAWSDREQKEKQEMVEGPRLTVQQSQRMLMKQLQMKIMPDTSALSASIWKPIEHQTDEVKDWRWQNYSILSSLTPHFQSKHKKKHVQNKLQQKSVKEEKQLKEEKVKKTKDYWQNHKKIYDQI